VKSRTFRVIGIGLVALSLLCNVYLLVIYSRMRLDHGNILARLADYIPHYLGYAESTVQSAVAGTIKDYILLSQADPYLRAAADSIRHLKYLDFERSQVWEDIATAVDEARYAMSFDRLGITPEWDSIPSEVAQKLEAIHQLLADLKTAFPGKISYGQHPEVTFDSERVRGAHASAVDYLKRSAR